MGDSDYQGSTFQYWISGHWISKPSHVFLHSMWGSEKLIDESNEATMNMHAHMHARKK